LLSLESCRCASENLGRRGEAARGHEGPHSRGVIVIRDMYLLQVKSPEESKGPWDYMMKVISTIPGE
jgi:branched-chain amino acid transport system substrate-binding protein